MLDNTSWLGMGSSPLTRGAQDSGVVVAHNVRLIHAHAGSTPWVLVIQVEVGAHPRSRGEHYFDLLKQGWELGSSPLTRGALAWPARG